MPLTAKEKMKRYRARLRASEERYEAAKRRDRERKIAQKIAMSQKEKEDQKVKNRETVKKYRQKNTKKDDKIPQQNLVVFHSPQSLGKAKKKLVPHLPKSPRKRVAVIAALATDAGISCGKIRRSDTGGHTMDKELIDKVTNFYLKTSWICPGKNDVVIVRKPGKEKTKLQKQYLLTTLKAAHAIFLDEHPDKKISFSKFADLRPPQVQLQRDVPHNACLCKYHENVRMLLQSLNKSGLNIPTSFRDFIALIVCNQDNENCMDGSCMQCAGLQTLAPSASETDSTVPNMQWQQWSVEAGKVTKVAHQGTVAECYNELLKQTPFFLKHTFVKRVQAAAFVAECDSVKNDGDKVVIQVDFADNFTTKTQNEIQSAYWAYNQVTLFTACAWEHQNKHAMVVVSDYLHHDKYAVNLFLKTILQHLDSTVQRFNKVVIFSDGAASQFKQHYLLSSITLLNRNISWNFFATSHGKGPVDGIGGITKRLVCYEVMSGKAEVTTSIEFSEVAARKCSNGLIKHICKTDVEAEIPKLDEAWVAISAIPFTKQVHSHCSCTICN